MYGGDGGTVDFSGRTQRLGFDLSARYELVKAIFFDLDVNYAHGRSLDDAAGKIIFRLRPYSAALPG